MCGRRALPGLLLLASDDGVLGPEAEGSLRATITLPRARRPLLMWVASLKACWGRG